MWKDFSASAVRRSETGRLTSSRCSALSGEVRQAFPQTGSSQPSTHAPPNLPFFRSLPSLMRAAERAHHVTVLEPGEGKKSSCHRTAMRREKRRRCGGSLLLSLVEIIKAGANARRRITHTHAHILSSTKHDFNLLLGRYATIPKHVKHT